MPFHHFFTWETGSTCNLKFYWKCFVVEISKEYLLMNKNKVCKLKTWLEILWHFQRNEKSTFLYLIMDVFIIVLQIQTLITSHVTIFLNCLFRFTRTFVPEAVKHPESCCLKISVLKHQISWEEARKYCSQ